MTQPNDWNAKIMKEFRENGGKVGGNFANANMLILTTTGAKSGKPRTNPLVYLPDGDDMVIIASKGGAPENPAWYHNLRANPEATVEVGTETVKVTAAEVTGAEREELYARQAAVMPGFADYEKKTSRKIPVVRLKRR
jgi:deazaflavin-dependent oxidoreductase (nitroreductase family)